MYRGGIGVQGPRGYVCMYVFDLASTTITALRLAGFR